MPDDNDTKKIIKEFLDLWQKQFAYMTKEPETVAQMLRIFQHSQENFCSNFNSNEEKHAQQEASTDIPRNADVELCKLRDRIESLEKRCDQLESQLNKSSKRSTKANK